MRRMYVLVISIGVLAVSYFLLRDTLWLGVVNEFPDYKNIAYTIGGESVLLENGLSVSGELSGSAEKVTRYFGNELWTDLDGDGREDVVFLLTQETGGSSTFYYVVAARSTDGGYIGSDGYLLGDRIAPQTTALSQNPRQKYVVVVHYADRARGESMTVRPSIGKSVYLKLNPATMQWGIVLSPEEQQSL